MDELPELPFEKVLSYLNLEDRLRSRGVSRRWYHQINRFKVNTLCYSQFPTDFTYGKVKQNFISSQHFECFFNTFHQTILSNLKHLQLCDLRPKEETGRALTSAINSLAQLEELDIQFGYHRRPGVEIEFKLNLPMLAVIQLKLMYTINKLTLDSPRLRKVTLYSCRDMSLELVHSEPVEWLMAHGSTNIAVEKLKNVKNLYLSGYFDKLDSTFLSSLEQLKEIHLDWMNVDLEELFEQKQRHGRTNLKIYYRGLLLNGPHDPAIGLLRPASDISAEYFGHLAENPSRLADQIPIFERLGYTLIERVAPGTEMTVLKRFTNLSRIDVSKPVVDTDRFLNLLKNLHNIVCLMFQGNQPQDLFDRLPEHCAVQILYIHSELSDYRFLFRLKYLMRLLLGFSINAEAIRKIIEKNEFLSVFYFKYLDKEVDIEIEHPRHFKVQIDYYAAGTDMLDLDAAIELITGES